MLVRRSRCIALGLLTALALLSPVAAQARVPRGFVGMGVLPPLYPPADPSVDVGAQLDAMVASGVENLRVVFNWSAAQPYASWSAVPPADVAQFTNAGGIPTDFSQIDTIMALAAQRRLTVLPLVLYAPSWDARRNKNGIPEPARAQPYANFLKALVGRYGPHGSFWTGRSPIVPIRFWQIWNEPSIRYFWAPQPFAKSYVKLLRAAHDAVKHADPGAKIVLAGLPNYSWVALHDIYRVPGARKLFDVVAVHPYTRSPEGMITIIQRVRAVMNQFGDKAKPIVADEVAWTSSRGKTPHTNGFDFGTTESGQAKRIAALLPMLGRERHSLGIAGFDYLMWAGTDQPGGDAFTFGGLLHYSAGQFTNKPALAAFTRASLALEHCRKKGSVATICAKPG